MPSISDLFGPTLVVAAVVLTAWEVWVYRHRDGDAWLITPRRLRRRLILSAVLGLVGVLIQLEASGLIVTAGRPAVLLAFVTGLGGLSICLVVLAIADVHDTATLAARRSLKELEEAMSPRQQQAGPEKDSTSQDDGSA